MFLVNVIQKSLLIPQLPLLRLLCFVPNGHGTIKIFIKIYKRCFYVCQSLCRKSFI